MVAFIGCSEDDLIEPTPSPEIPAGNQGVYFPASNKSAFAILTEDPAEIEITIARNASEGAVDVPLTQEVNDDNIFVVPATVSFAAGEKETTFKVTFPNAAIDKAYNLKLNVEGEQYVNPYQEGLPHLVTKVTVSEPEDWVWETLTEPMIYIDGAFTAWFGVGQEPMYVYGEKGTLGDVTRYKLKNVYKVPVVGADADGIYDGYPENDPGDFDESKDYFTTIEIGGSRGTAKEVYMDVHEIGVVWGYGMHSIGSVFGNLTSGGEPVSKDDYPLGILEDGIITFPANSLYLNLPTEGIGIAAKPTTIYLSKEIYDADNMAIKDFNDLEYELIEGEEGTFASNAFSDSWSQSIAKAIDIDEENPGSAFKNLFFLADLYADGKGVAFYYDEESGEVTIPENQPIGATVFGQDLYVSASEKNKSSVEVKENGLTEYTLGMIFHYKDGTIVGDFAERYLYSEDAITYEMTDYIGNFTMTGFSLFQGEEDAVMNVKIAKGENDNELLITGIDLAEEVVATFDPSTSFISIEPQTLADYGNFDITLLTVTLEGGSLDITDEAIIDLQRNIVGDVVLTPYSAAVGYVLESQVAGGYVDGYYNIEFTSRPVASSSMNAQRSSAMKVQSPMTSIGRIDNAKTKVNNFKVQGKKSTRQIKKVKNNVQRFHIFR